MDLVSAQEVTLRTHLAALEGGYRASAQYWESGPGIGKSESQFQIAQRLAQSLGEPVGIVQFMLATISSVDVRGFLLPIRPEAPGAPPQALFSVPPWYPSKSNMHVVEPDGTWHGPGEWDRALPRVGVLFLDEFGQAEDEVKKPAAELLLHGNVGTCALPPGWRVIAAGNRMSDRSGVVRELMFLVNRRCRVAIDASLPVWIDWANRQKPEHRPHYLTLSFAQKNPDIVFRDSVPDGTDPFCTPRTLCLMDRDLRALRRAEDIERDRLPMDPIAREVCAGWIGPGSAAQFFTHIKYADELPDLDDVIKDPLKAKLPDERSAQMVCGYMLAHHVNEKNASPIMRYITRMNIEMQVLAVRAACPPGAEERAAAVMATGEWRQWLTRHKDLLIASRS